MSDSEKFWDKTAQRYAKSPVADEESYQKKLAETQSFLKPHMQVVEFGCGTGTTAIEHAPHVQHIDAIDISQNMLDIGRQKAKEAGVDNITFTKASLVEFQAKDESVDAVLGLNVLHLLPDRQDTIAEVARILKPGGLFVSSTVCLGKSPLRLMKLAVPLVKFFGLMPDIFILTESDLASEITQAGFEIERQWHHGKGGIAVFIVARKK